MKGYKKAIRKGFTLLELTLAMAVGVTIGSILLAMLNQQIAFVRIFQAQSFINEEAPIISANVSKLVSQADRFRLHSSLAEALSGNNPSLTDSPVLVLNFRLPDGTVRAGILSFEDVGAGSALYYYVVPESGVLADPQWAISTRPTDVSFFVENGILRTKITGPAGEELFFSGSME
ncbi:type II secretion system protein J [Luteolibacter sp. AS25]|uniref:PulJ/GspJ family protein n=1 Tax=Luteolibacter sp. AS25 TaxID=3135776 RepID=UPI00398B65FA